MSRRRRPSTHKSPNETDTSSPATPAIDHLVVMRESAVYDEVLMEGMVDLTLSKVSHLPSAPQMREIGMGVFENPAAVGAVARKVGRSRMVTVEKDGVLYLYSMGSAALADSDDDDNAFIAELVRVIATFRPRFIWAHAFTRLTRSAEHAGDLLKVVSEHVEVLHCEAEIRVSTPEGRMLFQMLTMIAAAERDYIVRRHTAGRVAQCRRGIWIPQGYPPGYSLDDNGRLQLDETQIEPVRQLLQILANPSISTSAAVMEAGALGISTPKIRQIYGDDATLADAQNPTEALRTLRGWVEVLRDGKFDLRWPIHSPG